MFIGAFYSVFVLLRRRPPKTKAFADFVPGSPRENKSAAGFQLLFSASIFSF
jgi:hypothetical protein